jgi:hypothetical protein
VREDDVEREEGGVGEGEGDPERLSLQSHIREHVDACSGERERETVTRGADTERGEQNHGQELDRGNSAERQPVDRQVEAAVHHGEDGAEPKEQPQREAVDESQRPPRGCRQAAKTAAALTIRSQATPTGWTRANSSTAKAGPR